MSEKRTRKEKSKAHHQFTINWSREPNKSAFEPGVKGQFRIDPETKLNKGHNSISAINMAKEESLPQIKRDIARSLILASLILGTEVVIYLLWH